MSALLLFAAVTTFAQTRPAPGVEWRNVEWWEGEPGESYIEQNNTADDWWYDLEKVYTGGVHTGYIVCGYARYLNKGFDEAANNGTGCFQLDLDSTGVSECDFETPTRKYGYYIGTVALYDLGGKIKWNKSYIGGSFERIIVDKDGNYVCIGYNKLTKKLHDTYGSPNGGHLYYNPTHGVPNSNNYFKKGVNCLLAPIEEPQQKLSVVKIDPNGNEIWNYIYGIEDFVGNGVSAYLKGVDGWDIVENNSGGYRIVGQEKFKPAKHAKIVVMDLDNDGFINWKNSFYAVKIMGDTLKAATYKYPTLAKGPNSKYYIAVGSTTTFNPANGEYPTDYSVSMYTYNGENAQTYSSIDSYATPEINKFGSWIQDLKVKSDGKIFLPIVTECKTECHGGWEGEVYIVDPVTRLPIDTAKIGVIRAFDMRIGITFTKDNGFALVTSRRVDSGTPGNLDVNPDYPHVLGCEGYGYNLTSTNVNSNAYVAKFDSNYEMEWDRMFDVEDVPRSRVLFPGDFKLQECLYNIVEADADSGLVICGNTSHNLDDYYLAKIASPCQTRVQFDLKDLTDNVIDIQVPTVWTGNHKIVGVVKIHPGASLIIQSGTYEFADTRKIGIRTGIVVEPGGVLTVNSGAILQALQNCPSSMWDGIEVVGNSNLRQTPPTNQGQAYLFGAEIRNTIYGIQLARINSYQNFSIVSGTTGGILTATDAIFRDNRVAVRMHPYHSKTLNNNPISNRSTFTRCQFVLNGLNDKNLLERSEYQKAHGYRYMQVRLQEVDGVVFNGCKFSASSLFDYDHQIDGIRAYDAGFSLSSSCNAAIPLGQTCPAANVVRGRFENLGIAINAMAELAPFVSITAQDLVNNYKGVELVGMSGTQVFKNNFVLKELGPNDFVYGVTSFGSRDITIDENVFNKSSLAFNFSFPFLLSGSQTSAPLYYKNTINETYTGVQAQDTNLNTKIDCNRFNAATKNMVALNIMGILNDQGSCNTPGIPPVSNFFAGTCAKLLPVASTLSTFDYNGFSNSPGYPNVQPACGNIFVNDCDQLPGAGICASIDRSIIKVNLNVDSARTILGGIRQRIASIDGGNTLGMMQTINSGNQLKIRTELTKASPYLSDEVLIKAIRTSSISSLLLYDILVKNAPLTVPVKAALSERSPNSIFQGLIVSNSSVSPRKTLEDQVLSLTTELLIVNNQVVAYYLDQGDFFAAQTYLTEFDIPQAVLRRAELQLQLDPSTTSSLVSQATVLANSYPFKHFDSFKIDHDLTSSIANSVLAQQNPTTFMERVNDYTNKGGSVQAKAESFLCKNEIHDYFRHAQIGNATINVVAKSEEGKSREIEVAKFVEVYPNPANNLVNFSFNSDFENSSIQIKLLDYTGRLVSQSVHKNQSEISIELSDLSTGVYYFQIMNAVQQTQNGILYVQSK